MASEQFAHPAKSLSPNPCGTGGQPAEFLGPGTGVETPLVPGVGTVPPWRVVVRWLAVFMVAFVVYAITASRGPQWQDSGYFILSIVKGEMVNPLGLALTHPLHYWLGRLALLPGTIEPCYAITLVSALGAAVAVANVFGCIRSLVGRTGPALFAAASLGVAHTFWHLATVTEVYTLTAATLTGECWCVVAFLQRRRPGLLIAACLLNGAGIANHLQAGLTTPLLLILVFVAVARGQTRLRHAMLCGLLWLVGTLPYTAVVLGMLASSGDWVGTLRSTLFGGQAHEAGYADQVLNIGLSMRILLVSAGFTLLSFPNFLLPAAAAGLARWRRVGIPAGAFAYLLAALLIHLLFVVRYDVVDQHTFFLPAYALLAIFGGVGAAAVSAGLTGRSRTRVIAAAIVLLALTPMVYLLAPPICRKLDVLRDVKRHKPYRDDYIYLFLPWGFADDSADRLSRQAIELASPDGCVLVEDLMAIFAIEYQAWAMNAHEVKIEYVGPHQHATIVETAGNLTTRGKPVVWIPADTRRPPPEGVDWQPRGDLYVAGAPTNRNPPGMEGRTEQAIDEAR